MRIREIKSMKFEVKLIILRTLPKISSLNFKNYHFNNLSWGLKGSSNQSTKKIVQFHNQTLFSMDFSFLG